MTAFVAAVLAGGASRRMGIDKAGLARDGQTLLERTVALLAPLGVPTMVVGRERPALWPHATTRFVPDAGIAHQGPLAGVAAALGAIPGSAVLVLPCDLPALTTSAIEALIAAWRAAAPAPAFGLVLSIEGELQPLAAVYAPAAGEVLDRAWARGERSLQRIIRGDAGFAVALIDPAHATAWADCDTPEQWARLGP